MMDQLYCQEATHEIETNRARADRVLFDDTRIVPNLLTCERKYHPACDYLVKVQTDIKQHMRREVASWMLEVCEERGCEEVVFPLAVNIMDRFLSLVNIHRSQLQLLASVCLLASSKLRQTRSFTVDQLCYYTDHSITPEEVISWELLVLTKLGWDLGSIVATDFVDYTLNTFQKHAKLGNRVRQHTFTFISLCAIECQFLIYTPSIIAGASIAAAINGLHSGQNELLENTLSHLQATLCLDQNLLQRCINEIEELLTSSVMTLQQPTSNGKNSSSTSSNNKMPSTPLSSPSELSQPETPTDVQDVHF